MNEEPVLPVASRRSRRLPDDRDDPLPVLAQGLGDQLLDPVGVPGIWFPFNIGVSRTQYEATSSSALGDPSSCSANMRSGSRSFLHASGSRGKKSGPHVFSDRLFGFSVSFV